MEKVGFIVKVLRESSLDSIFGEIKKDENIKRLENEFYEKVIDKLPKKESEEADDIYSDLTARTMELSYLMGIKDAIRFLYDMENGSLADIYNAALPENDIKPKSKVVLHLPKFKWQEQLIAIYDKPFREELFSRLREDGYDSWYIQSVMSTYEGREFGEDIMIIYGDAGQIIKIFEDVVKNNHDELDQKSYVYEVDNTLHFF